MTEINLLPWREQRRSERSRQVMILTAAAWVVSVVLVFLATQIMGARIDNQRERNRYLQLEIDQLQLVVSEIDQLRGKKTLYLLEWM
ncbi:MAG: hypothetical protein HOM55_10020 [Proteobacteria bacterium]|mgnify:FL=1|nr:hypothetical protein [Pseudomonadota bacterium]